ncbi:serine protease nudel [Anopheles ziemanni]|uniref:serine protease nudel n=1 Tax=Anopheles coustani TaxID=139045 RepID=UPI00265822A4|nr:serine protease nudel [Anopheles coustani]XP_058178301.1 serine protease nudel [Anopheles ziemanni]
MIKLDQMAQDEELSNSSDGTHGLSHVHRTNLLCLMLTAVGGVIIMGTIAFGFYMCMPASAVLIAVKEEYEVSQGTIGDEMEDIGVRNFKREAYNALVRSLELLELMENLEPLYESHQRMKRELPEPAPNRISRDDRSEEITYGVRRRVQREDDLGTLPIAYGGFFGGNGGRGPRRKRHLSLEELERAKRNAQKDYHRLEHEYYRCRKEAPNAKICDQIYEKLQRLSEEVNARFQEMANLLQNIQEPATSKSPSFPSVVFGVTEAPKTKVTVVAPPRTTTYRTESHVPKYDPEIETVEQLVNQMNISQGSSNGGSSVRKFDPRLHYPVENSSIQTLDDLFDHIDLGFVVTTELPKGTTVGYEFVDNTSHSSSSHSVSTTSTTVRTTTVSQRTTTDHDSEETSFEPNRGLYIKPATPPPNRWSTTKSPSQAARNLHDVVEQLQLAQMLQLQPAPFHEDLGSPPSSISEFVMARSRNREHTHHDHDQPTGLEPDPVASSFSDGSETLRSAQHQLVVGPSAPFLNLCEQLRSANGGGASHTGHVKPTHPGTFHTGSIQPGIPFTGEATKASSQIIVNSAYGAGYVPNTVCFYQNAPPTAAVQTPYAFRPANTYGYPNGAYPPPAYQHHQQPHPAAGGKLPLNDPAIDALIEPRIPQAMINMPVSIQNHQHPGSRASEASNAPNNPILLCSMMYNGEQHAGLPPAAATVPQPTYSAPSRHQFGNETSDHGEEGEDLASMFASGRSLAARAKGRQHCRRGWVPCFSSHQCVRRKSWCDSKTDCMDGSDESACSCVSRLPKRKLCDGYADCPLGMDEMGCFGCEKFSFSCFHNEAEYQMAHRSGSMCYTLIEKCDGFDNCLNRKDEEDCTMLVRDLGHYLAYSVPHSSGVLHRNYKGKWYPVCHNGVQWAREACEAELGPLTREPQLSHGHGALPGPYISQAEDSAVAQPVFSETCNGVYLNVKCPPVHCGTSKLHEMHSARVSVRTRRNVTTDDELVEAVRIVGGSDAEPGAYPFIVGIFRDGKFHCGGSIYNEHWIISAAHCCDNFQHHYFEVRSGMLRKRSFAPQVQVTRVTHMIVHHAYSATLMANDIALMRVEHPFHYNRWVRPICLPAKHRTTNDRDWLWGPPPGTVCTAVGWGALRERGGAPDHLKEVSVPILRTCKHKVDRDSLQICAAEEEGGHDACQGDSGGPFVCKSSANPYEWYLAGVVSHGEGCARAHEPGVYTRVALFVDWIAQKVREPLPSQMAGSDCPGMRCIWGGGVCLPPGKKCNGFVNCLGGEDESGCEMDRLLRSMSNRGDEESEELGTTPRDMGFHENRQADGATISVDLTTMKPEESTTTTQEESAEAHESMIVTHTITTDEPSTTHASSSEESTTETSTTEESTSEPPTTEESATEELSSTVNPSTTEQATTTTSSTTTHAVTTDSSAIVFQDDTITTQGPIEFEIIAPSVPSTTEAIWKAVEKTVLEVRGQARVDNGSMPALTAETSTSPDQTDEPQDDLLDPADHPFFEEIDTMHKEKHKRVAKFRMTVHNLHTKTNAQLVPANVTAKYRQFWCQNITQRINMAHRCDRIIDCEDGSDELNCTCRDFLKDKFDFLICDGKTDCLDRTDEENCMNCHVDQYACRISQECIPKEKVCNGHPDCRLHEDELDCLALTDGHRVYFDANNLTLFRNTGIVTKNTNGTWEVVCGAVLTGKTEHAVEKICSFLGFAGSRNYSLVKLEQHDLPAGVLVTVGDNYQNLTVNPTCQALKVSCAQHINATEHEIAHFDPKPTEEPVQVDIRPLNPIHRPHHMPQIVFQENAHIELIENFGDDYDWPWNTNIYLDGALICSGLIIDAAWIIVASSCTRLVNMRHQYVAVVAGGAKSYLHIAGPYEQVVRVDCYHFIPEAETVMLHLEHKLNFSRHVLPTFVPENENVTDSECLAVGQDKYGRTKTLRVHLNSTNCQGERVRCYHKDLKQPYFHHEYCYTQEATRSGVIVCKTSRSGWYPVGFYQNKRGLCGFNEVVRVTSLVESYHKIQHVLHDEQCAGQYYEEPKCTGKRCRYGKCVGETLLCDRKNDCGDGSDEDQTFCAARNRTTNCLPHQLRCANGKCIDKSSFCDRKNDCGDSTDEPHDCSCYTYLRITDPGKICDGVRNCWDKSDENPRVCRCHATSFRCGESDICVPYDFVCDKERDCPNGEDELYCYALQQNSYEAGYGELMEQSYGIWHSKCFPKTAQFDDEYMRRVCEQLGYSQVRKIYGRAIVEEARLRTTANDTESPVEKLRRAATKTVVQNKFSKVVINANHTFYMKPSRPMFKVINWNQEDQQNCHRLELLCAP